jgi:AcrR family transcriptional regulator
MRKTLQISVKLSMEDIAKLCGVPVSTLYRWKKSDPKLWSVIVRGCMEAKLDKARADS